MRDLATRGGGGGQNNRGTKCIMKKVKHTIVSIKSVFFCGKGPDNILRRGGGAKIEVPPLGMEKLYVVESRIKLAS